MSNDQFTNGQSDHRKEAATNKSDTHGDKTTGAADKPLNPDNLFNGNAISHLEAKQVDAMTPDQRQDFSKALTERGLIDKIPAAALAAFDEKTLKAWAPKLTTDQLLALCTSEHQPNAGFYAQLTFDQVNRLLSSPGAKSTPEKLLAGLSPATISHLKAQDGSPAMELIIKAAVKDWNPAQLHDFDLNKLNSNDLAALLDRARKQFSSSEIKDFPLLNAVMAPLALLEPHLFPASASGTRKPFDDKGVERTAAKQIAGMNPVQRQAFVIALNELGLIAKLPPAALAVFDDKTLLSWAPKLVPDQLRSLFTSHRPLSPEFFARLNSDQVNKLLSDQAAKSYPEKFVGCLSPKTIHQLKASEGTLAKELIVNAAVKYWSPEQLHAFDIKTLNAKDLAALNERAGRQFSKSEYNDFPIFKDAMGSPASPEKNLPGKPEACVASGKPMHAAMTEAGQLDALTQMLSASSGANAGAAFQNGTGFGNGGLLNPYPILPPGISGASHN